ncbi:MAG: ABC transporter substrate-binding protein [Sporomusaceae bacterium]|nr:ABC transporter substrate-binding protein [Sporomusaceae bacterium]
MTAVMTAGLVAGCGGGGAADSKTVKLGIVYELTGNTAAYGAAALNGAKLAVKEINANGGVLGKQIEAVVGDNKGEPSESANAMTKVITQDKVIAVTGFTTSSNGIAASAVAEANKIPFMTANCTNPKVTVDEKSGKVKDYTFRVSFIDPFQGTVGANFALNTLKVKKVATLIDNSSDYSKGLAQFFKEAFTKGGGEVIDEQAYLQKDQDFKTILTKIKAENPELIYVPGYYDEVGKIIKQARELGITAPFLGGDGWDSAKLVEIAGAPNLNNTFFTTHYSAEDSSAKSKAFVEAYKKEYNTMPEANAVLAYDAVYAMVDAIKRANSLEPTKIKDALAATKDFEGVTGKISLNDKHDAVKHAVIVEFKDGKQTFKQNVEP